MVGRVDDSAAGRGDSPDVLTFSESLILTGRDCSRRKACKENGRDREKLFDASRMYSLGIWPKNEWMRPMKVEVVARLLNG